MCDDNSDLKKRMHFGKNPLIRYFTPVIQLSLLQLDEDLHRRSFALELLRFSGEHTYDRIGAVMQSSLQRNGISNGKVRSVTTDNG